MNKKTIYQVIVDQSGSMTGSEKQVVDGFNEKTQAVKNILKDFPNQEIVMGLRFFNTIVDNNTVDFKPVNQIEPLSIHTYNPNGGTALLDAIGKSIYDIKTKFGHEIEENLATVVLIIITDGYENTSRFYTYPDIRRMINELEASEKWNFNFIGADLDAMEASKNFGIHHQAQMSISKEVYASFCATNFEKAARNYASEKSMDRKSSGFFSIFDKKDLRK
jgi:hypothetical protein